MNYKLLYKLLKITQMRIQYNYYIILLLQIVQYG